MISVMSSPPPPEDTDTREKLEPSLGGAVQLRDRLASLRKRLARLPRRTVAWSGVAVLCVGILGLLWSRSLADAGAQLLNTAAEEWPWGLTILAGVLLLMAARQLLLPTLQNKHHDKLELAVASLRAVETRAAEQASEDQRRRKEIGEERRGRIENAIFAAAIIAVLLAGTSAGLFVYSQTPEVTDRPPSRSTQAVQSAALVSALTGGAVTLWLSNRRRAHDEATLHQERTKSENELRFNRERNEEEQFAKAIELLGHSNASVRVGALHALQGLAVIAAARSQTILHVMSAYLRQPFDHPAWHAEEQNAEHPQHPVTARTWTAAEAHEADREREVRRTAMQLIAQLLREHRTTSTHSAVLDLTGAHLDEVNLSGLELQIAARGAHFHGRTHFDGATIRGIADFSSAFFHARTSMDYTKFQGFAVFDGTNFWSVASFNYAEFRQKAMLHDVQFHARASFAGASFKRHALIEDCRFWGTASFAHARFDAGVNFDKSQFTGSTRIEAVEFRGMASFTHTWFYEPVKFDGSEFHAEATLGEAAFYSDATLRNVWFKDPAQHPGKRLPRPTRK